MEMEARRTFGGASGSKQLGIMLVAIIAAVVLAVAGVMLAKSLSVGSAPLAPAVNTYVDSPKDFPDRATHSVTTSNSGAPQVTHIRPGLI
jgi:hypothetical protein